MPVTINNITQLESLLNKNKRVDFIFGFNQLSSTENQLWFERIKKNYFACGCKTGKIFLMYTFPLIFSALLFIYLFQRNKLTFMVYVCSVLLVFIMAVIGKATGKLLAYKNLKNDVAELRSVLNY